MCTGQSKASVHRGAVWQRFQACQDFGFALVHGANTTKSWSYYSPQKWQSSQNRRDLRLWLSACSSRSTRSSSFELRLRTRSVFSHRVTCPCCKLSPLWKLGSLLCRFLFFQLPRVTHLGVSDVITIEAGIHTNISLLGLLLPECTPKPCSNF